MLENQLINPFETNRITPFTDSITQEDIEDWKETIFQTWYTNQDQSVTKIIPEIMVKQPASNQELMYNLFCLAYLYAQRTYIRKQRQTKDFLKKKYAHESASFALDDVDFQHQVIQFLDTIKDQNLQNAFWGYFEERMQTAGNKPQEICGAKKGILSLREAIKYLTKEGYTVKLPTPKEDAYEKIDLFAQKDGIKYLFQIKSQSPGQSNDIQMVPANSWRELYPKEEIKKDQEKKYGYYLDAFEARQQISDKPLHALIMTIPSECIT